MHKRYVNTQSASSNTLVTGSHERVGLDLLHEVSDLSVPRTFQNNFRVFGPPREREEKKAYERDMGAAQNQRKQEDATAEDGFRQWWGLDI